MAARESTSTPSRSKITVLPSKLSGPAQAAHGGAAEHVGMSSAPPPDRRAAGLERLAARARRVAAIRRRVLAATLAAFALAWGAIVYDGSMGATTATTTVAATTTTAAPTPTASPTASSSSSDSGTSDSSTASSSTQDLTTQQS